MAMFDFMGLRKTLSGVKDRMLLIDQQMAGMAAERSALVRAPLPFDDFVDWICEQVDAEANGWPTAVQRMFVSQQSHLNSYLSTRGDGYDASRDFEATYPVADGGGMKIPLFSVDGGRGGSMGLPALFWSLRDPIKAGIRSAMESELKQSWPREVGMPRAERRKALARLDQQIESLEAERADIAKQLDELKIQA